MKLTEVGLFYFYILISIKIFFIVNTSVICISRLILWIVARRQNLSNVLQITVKRENSFLRFKLVNGIFVVLLTICLKLTIENINKYFLNLNNYYELWYLWHYLYLILRYIGSRYIANNLTWFLSAFTYQYHAHLLDHLGDQFNHYIHNSTFFHFINF